MKLKQLAQHPDFEVLIRNTASGLILRPELVLKDYWVTAVLRLLAGSEFRGRFLFKGGTSLSKGWKLIDRFSEDIDLLLTGENFSGPPDRKGPREKLMKEIRDYISTHLPLHIPDLQDKYFHTRDDLHMEARYVWSQANPPPKDAEQTVFLEAGFRGGVNPNEVVSLNSMVGDFILNSNLGNDSALQQFRDDFVPFELELLSPARTFFEKLLHLYAKLRGDTAQVRTRHIYDVVQIHRKFSDVRALIASGEHTDILHEAIAVSNEWYKAGLNEAEVDLHVGLRMSDEQAAILERAYVEEAVYYYRGQPSFQDLREGLEAIRASFERRST